MEAQQFRIILEHDKGMLRLLVTSTNGIKGAMDQVMTAENCPERAIVQITRLDHKQQP